jgi:hypothetical protein
MKNRYGFLEEKLLPWVIDEEKLKEAIETKKKDKRQKKELKN